MHAKRTVHGAGANEQAGGKPHGYPRPGQIEAPAGSRTLEGARRKVTEVKARMGVDGFKRDLGMGRSEVRAFFARFSEIFPDIETLLSSTVAADRKLAKGALAEFQAACETVKIYPHLLAVSEAPAARASELLARAQ